MLEVHKREECKPKITFQSLCIFYDDVIYMLNHSMWEKKDQVKRGARQQEE